MEFIKVTVHGIDKNNYLDPKYGGNAPTEFLNTKKLSIFSPEISWTPVTGAKSYAIECIDYDSAPVVGMVFIHWVAANIKTPHLAENASQTNKTILQGVNSSATGLYFSNLSDAAKKQINLECSGYVGPRPPNCDHHYTFNVYALDVELTTLQPPFFINEMHDAMRGNILGIGTCEVKYKQVK